MIRSDSGFSHFFSVDTPSYAIGQQYLESTGPCQHNGASLVFMCCVVLEIDLMHLTSSSHVNKRETDSGRKSGYYAAILSGKNDRGLMELKYSKAVCELFSHQRRK